MSGPPSGWLSRTYRQGRTRSAFTLIEVLVVVAIIALLAAILIPSLARAREAAKIISCGANSKQIATLTATYKAEHKGYVPVVFNYAANGDAILPHARFCWLPVAFRSYDKSLKNLSQIDDGNGGTFDPMTNWPPPTPGLAYNKRKEFEDRLMPDYYVCPFSRDQGEGWSAAGTMEVNGTHGPKPYDLREWKGRHISYWTWKWEGKVRRGRIPAGSGGFDMWPNDPCGETVEFCMGEGRPKYSALSWSFVKPCVNDDAINYEVPPGFLYLGDFNNKNGFNRHRKWSAQEAQRVDAPSLSEASIIFCIQGMSMGPGSSSLGKIRNTESHRSNMGGGTNLVFADSHVEWVRGTQVGWE